jgi:uncharacterized membrane-anchored protein YitT (DUF2179 family)
MLRVLDYKVTISFGYILNCGCCNLFCNVCVCVCVGFVLCDHFGKMCTCIYRVLYCLVYVYVLLLVMSVLPPSDNSIAVNNNNNLT